MTHHKTAGLNGWGAGREWRGWLRSHTALASGLVLGGLLLAMPAFAGDQIGANGGDGANVPPTQGTTPDVQLGPAPIVGLITANSPAGAASAGGAGIDGDPGHGTAGVAAGESSNGTGGKGGKGGVGSGRNMGLVTIDINGDITAGVDISQTGEAGTGGKGGKGGNGVGDQAVDGDVGPQGDNLYPFTTGVITAGGTGGKGGDANGTGGLGGDGNLGLGGNIGAIRVEADGSISGGVKVRATAGAGTGGLGGDGGIGAGGGGGNGGDGGVGGSFNTSVPSGSVVRFTANNGGTGGLGGSANGTGGTGGAGGDGTGGSVGKITVTAGTGGSNNISGAIDIEAKAGLGKGSLGGAGANGISGTAGNGGAGGTGGFITSVSGDTTFGNYAGDGGVGGKGATADGAGGNGGRGGAGKGGDTGDISVSAGGSLTGNIHILTQAGDAEGGNGNKGGTGSGLNAVSAGFGGKGGAGGAIGDITNGDNNSAGTGGTGGLGNSSSGKGGKGGVGGTATGGTSGAVTIDVAGKITGNTDITTSGGAATGGNGGTGGNGTGKDGGIGGAGGTGGALGNLNADPGNSVTGNVAGTGGQGGIGGHSTGTGGDGGKGGSGFGGDAGTVTITRNGDTEGSLKITAKGGDGIGGVGGNGGDASGRGGIGGDGGRGGAVGTVTNGSDNNAGAGGRGGLGGGGNDATGGIGGAGGDGKGGNAVVNVTNKGDFATTGANSIDITATGGKATGGAGGNGGDATTGNAGIGGFGGAGGELNGGIGGPNGNTDNNGGLGGDGGHGGAAAAGAGGVGGNATGGSATVDVTNSGSITTTGGSAIKIIASGGDAEAGYGGTGGDAIGGQGGKGGNGGDARSAFGGKGGDGGDGGNVTGGDGGTGGRSKAGDAKVTVTNDGVIHATGDGIDITTTTGTVKASSGGAGGTAGGGAVGAGGAGGFASAGFTFGPGDAGTTAGVLHPGASALGGSNQLGIGRIIVNNNNLIDVDGTGVKARAVGDNSAIQVTNTKDILGGAKGLDLSTTSPIGTGIEVNNSGLVTADSFFAIDAKGTSATINNESAGIIRGKVDLSEQSDNFNNKAGSVFEARGTSDFRGGDDVFDNQGTVLSAVDANVTFNDLEFFYNKTGAISMTNGRAGDTLTMNAAGPGTKYLGGGDLAVDAVLGPTGTGVSDKLVITGTTDGTTKVTVNVLGASGGNVDGIPVVTVSGVSHAGDFVLAGGPINAGFFAWDMRYDGLAKEHELYSSGLNRGAYEFAAGITAAQDIWHQTTGTLLQRQADLRPLLEGAQVTPVADFSEPVQPTPTAKVTPGFWFKGVGAWLDRDEGKGATSTDRDQSIYGALAGFDFGTESGGQAWMFGLFGGYIGSTLDFDHTDTEWKYDGPTVGAYASYIDHAFYVDAVVKADFLDIDIDAREFSATTGKADTDVTNIGGQIDAGYKLGLSEGLFIEPQATLAVVNSDIDDAKIFGGEVDFDNETSVRGRLGLRLGYDQTIGGGTVFSSDVTASVWQEFNDGNDVSILAPGTPAFGLSDDPGKTVGDVSLGFSVAGPEGWSGFLRGNYQFADDYEAYIGNAGLRFAW